MAVFATVADLVVRWRPLSTDEVPQAQILLEDASVIVAHAVGPVIDVEIAKIVVCDMVKSAMMGPANAEGAASMQDTAGPFTQSRTFSNPNGDLFLSKRHRKLLGLGQVATSYDMGTWPEPFGGWPVVP